MSAYLLPDGGIECDTCHLFGVPDYPCYDATCGCSQCERIRAEQDDRERLAPFARQVRDAKARGLRYVVAS